MKKAIIITGPTAIGKTSLALKIAKKVNGALISVDSIQVYKNCDIISGKDIPKNSDFKILEDDKLSEFSLRRWIIDGTQLYLTDVVEPTYNFNVADFLSLCQKALLFIRKENKTPIFVGGTTLYIKSLLNPPDTVHIAPNPILRERLKSATVKQLQAILAKYDRKKLAHMNESDVNNPRRLIRSIEIAKSRKKNKTQEIGYNFTTIGLKTKREILKKRIDERVEKRLKNDAIEEAKKLFKEFDNLSPNVQTANGYRQLFKFLKGDLSKEKAVEQWKKSEYLHAKNQMTFLDKIPDINWFDISSNNYPTNAISYVEKWLP